MTKNETLLGDLRGGLYSSGLCKQLRSVAADEIERLQKALNVDHEFHNIDDVVEIRKLRAALDSETQLHLAETAKAQALIIGLKDERDRLQAALESVQTRLASDRGIVLRSELIEECERALSGEPRSPAEPSEERVPSDLELIEAASELHQRLELDQLELDADAKRVLYGNLRRLYRRSEKSSEIGTGDCSGNHAPHVRCRYCPPERTSGDGS